MKLNRVVVLAAVLLGMVQCGKSSSDKSDGVNTDKLKGIWQLTQVKRIVEEQSGEGEAAKSKDKAQDPQDVEEDKSRFVLISVNKVNMMDAQTNSEECDLNRDYEVSGRELNLIESQGCVANRLEIHKQEDDKIELSGLRIIGDFGKAKSLIYIFERINVAGMRIHFKSLNLAAAQYPSAYSGYMKDQEKNDPNFRAPKDDGETTSGGSDPAANLMFFPREGKDSIAIESFEFVTEFDYSAYYQAGKIVDYDELDSEKSYCAAYKASSTSELKFPHTTKPENIDAALETRGDQYSSYSEPSGGADDQRVGVTINFPDDLDAIDYMECYSDTNVKTFSMLDLRLILGSQVLVKY